MRFSLTLLLLLSCSYSFSQEVQGTQHVVEPVGKYKEINIENDTRVIKIMIDNGNADQSKIIDSVEQSPNKYIPPVLYVLSYVLFNSGKKPEAAYWFYLAQLRARYDVNRCTDKTANASSYNQNFGPAINEYATKDLDSLQVLIDKVVSFERSNEETYDQRWINLTGMNAMMAGLGDKKKTNDNQLSLPKEQWADIKKKTIDDYLDGFKQALDMLRKKRQTK